MHWEQNRTKNPGAKSRFRYNHEKRTSSFRTRTRDLKMEKRERKRETAAERETAIKKRRLYYNFVLHCFTLLHMESFLRAIYQFGVSEPNDDSRAPLLKTRTPMTQLKRGPHWKLCLRLRMTCSLELLYFNSSNKKMFTSWHNMKRPDPTTKSHVNTVDGRNPAPPGMYKNLVNNGIHHQLVQDVFHQLYLRTSQTSTR